MAAALPPLLLLLASSAAAGSFDYHVGVDHAGGDIQDKPRKGADGRPVARGQPFPLPKSNSNMTDYQHCHDACVAYEHCAGWVVTPSYCSYAGRPQGVAGCWLKGVFAGEGSKADCRVSGFVRAPPPPPPRPPLPQPPQPTKLTVDAATVTHQLRKLDMGCHSDSGYSHEPRALYSQMIYGSSFESPYPVGADDGAGWRDASSGSGSAAIDPAEFFNGERSQKLSVAAGGGSAAVANRGTGNEGLVFSEGKEYEGYLFAKSAQATTLTVSIRDWSASPGGPGKVLASAELQVPAGNWSRLNFSLTTTGGGTNCEGIAPQSAEAVAANITCPVNETYNPTGRMSDRKAHICVKCGGEFEIALAKPGTVNVDFVFLQPGSWGRYKGLPVLKTGVQWMLDMGVSLFRQGGSFACGNYYFWKLWRGAPWLRPSMTAHWGHDLEGGWGPFEMIDMANAAGIEPVMTTFAVGVPPEDMADLVEYCYGDETTTWGKTRIVEDQHPEPYKLKYIELGNEQYNPGYVEQVAAMEARAKKVGVPKTIKYLFPQNGGVNSSDAPKAKALGLGANLVCDLHTGPTGGVNSFQSMLHSNNTGADGWGAINLETNCGDHTFRRALTEAADLNEFANEGSPRLWGRAGSFCMERSGYQEAGLNDQGIIFFLPNMTWGEPPFYARKMIHDTWQPQAVAVTADAGDAAPSGPEGRFSAQKSADGKTLVVRYVNNGPAQSLAITVKGMTPAATAKTWTMQNDDLTAVNTPAEPTKVVPTMATVPTASLSKLAVKAQSFVIVELTAK